MVVDSGQTSLVPNEGGGEPKQSFSAKSHKTDKRTRVSRTNERMCQEAPEMQETRRSQVREGERPRAEANPQTFQRQVLSREDVVSETRGRR